MIEVVRRDKYHVMNYPPGGGLFRLATNHASPVSEILPTIALKRSHEGYAQEELEYQHSVDKNSGYYGVIYGADKLGKISDGDIAYINQKGTIRIILSKHANANTLLLTERCDNRCLFCSQPPKEINDEWLLGQAATALIDFNSNQTIGISGGEPLLYGGSFISFINTLNRAKCPTPLHVLTNGRALKDCAYAEGLAKVSKERQISWGVPLYSCNSKMHDYLVGAPDAWGDTITGLINAGACGLPVELRIIPTHHNYQELPDLVTLISRCIPAATQISIMNLEPQGWARKNWRNLYVSPMRYTNILEEACIRGDEHGIDMHLYNYPRCHIPRQLWRYADKSISDWKNYYPEECNTCSELGRCCGYFSSAQGIYFDQPRPIR